MFKKKEIQRQMKEDIRTAPNVNMISSGTEIVGSLKSKSDIRISGKLDGRIDSSGKIIISVGGLVTGDVYGSEADVAGTVEGELIIQEKLILRKSAVVRGDISTKSLLVEEGARFDGVCNMSKTPKKESISQRELGHKLGIAEAVNS